MRARARTRCCSPTPWRAGRPATSTMMGFPGCRARWGTPSGSCRRAGRARPRLAYAAQPALTDHKVDGRTTPAATATVTVAVTSMPRLKSSESAPEDTYGRREIIEIVVTASEAVEVIGDPVFRFTIGTELVRAAYDRVQQHRNQAGVHLHGAGGRHGPRRDLDRRRHHHLRAGLGRAHPHGRAKDRHRPQPHRSRHAVRPQGGRFARSRTTGIRNWWRSRTGRRCSPTNSR